MRKPPTDWLHARGGRFTDELALTHTADGFGMLPSRLLPEATATTVCGFCSTGCQLAAHLRDGVAVNLSPSLDYPVNHGMACPKGWEALAPLAANDRATVPLLRSRDGGRHRVTWLQALDAVCDGFRAIQQAHGPDAVAFIGTGQIPTEELAFLGALAKFGMGMRHGDANTRQCMATAVAAYKESFGFDAPPYTYADFEQSDVLVLVGSNLCIAHPILWQRILRNPHRPEIIVIDPRRTETATAATQHIALAPRSDLILFYALARLLIRRGAIDRSFIAAHTTGFDAFRQHVEAYTLDRACAATGLSELMIERLASIIAKGRRVSFWWTMGVNQGHEATRTAQALINLALITGNIGRPGTGANSITGQCNAMGSRLFSNTTNLLGGHDFANTAHRQKVAQIMGIEERRIPIDKGWAYDQIVQGIHDGAIRALWIVGTNGAHSWVDQHAFHAALEKLDLLVVQDMYHSTETAVRAHVLLPAAGWGEKDGTFINSERRIARVRKVARAPGQALADFQIFRLIANRWGCGGMFDRWRSPGEAFAILQSLTRDQPCDFTGIAGYEMLDQAGGVQWPWSGDGAPEVERRLFADGLFFHTDGRARLCFDAPQPSPEVADAEYPLMLLTGRGSSAQWHTGTRTAKSPVLRALAPRRLLLELHPDDAAARGIVADDLVVIRSRRGSVTAHALLTTTVNLGQVFLPMHDAQTNRLTAAVFDPLSRQPSYKMTAVDVARDQAS